MALTANTIPSQIPFYNTPLDAALQFAGAQTLTATGFFNNVVATIDLGSANPASGAGRHSGMWAIDITACDFTSGDETYHLELVGSNDAAFGNGNVELLAFHDLAAAATGRVFPTVLGATPTIPMTNRAGSLLQIPYVNLMQGIVYRFIKMHATIGGTTPSITLSSWLSFSDVKF